MLKSTTVLFLVCAMLFVSLGVPASAQQVPAKQSVSTIKTDVRNPNLKDVFAKQTDIIKSNEAIFDPVKTERERGNQQAQQKGWSKTKKVLVISAIAVGVAALLFVLIKYGKDCVRSEPANCTPGVDVNCICLEYERRVQN